MPVLDVTAQTEIAAEPTDVASVMFDPQREREWIAEVERVDVIDPAIRPGARVRRTGRFLGQDVVWSTAVESFHFPHALVLQVTDGPFAGTFTYQIQRGGTGSVVRIRARGELSMPGAALAAMAEAPMRAALDANLGRLKTIVEKK